MKTYTLYAIRCGSRFTDHYTGNQLRLGLQNRTLWSGPSAGIVAYLYRRADDVVLNLYTYIEYKYVL